MLEIDPPPIPPLQPMTPPALDRLVKKCLAKEPEKRWQAASDVCDELKWIAEGGSQVGLAMPLVAQRKSRERLALSVVVVLLGAALALAGFEYVRRQAPPPQTMRFFVLPPETWTLAGMGTVTSGSAAPLSVSPDGRPIAFAAGGPDGKYLLFDPSLHTLPAHFLTTTQ